MIVVWSLFQVTLVLYAKNPLPAKSLVEANQVKLKAAITFGADQKEYENTFELFGTIDVEKSNVTYYASKVEVVMKKDEPITWTKLIYLPPN